MQSFELTAEILVDNLILPFNRWGTGKISIQIVSSPWGVLIPGVFQDTNLMEKFSIVFESQ